MFQENCGVLLSLVNDITTAIDDRIASLILFGSSVNKGCSKDSDIDLLLLIFDNSLDNGGEILFKAIGEIMKRYEANGYRLSLNILPVSDFIKRLVQGDSFAVKIINTGRPIIGIGVFSSLKKFLEKYPPIQDREQIARSIVSLVNNASAILEDSKRDLFVACGHLKTAVGYMLALSTGTSDPEIAIEKADANLSEIYLMLKDYCKKALKGELPPSALENALLMVKELVRTTVERFL